MVNNLKHQNKLVINIPVKLKYKVIYFREHRHIYVYSRNYFCKLILPVGNIIIKPELNLVCIMTELTSSLTAVLKNQINLITSSLTTYFLKKIKIAGKSYRIEKLGRGFNLTVGHTLDTHIFIPNLIQKQTTKHKLIFYYLNTKKLQRYFYKIIYLRL